MTHPITETSSPSVCPPAPQEQEKWEKQVMLWRQILDITNRSGLQCSSCNEVNKLGLNELLALSTSRASIERLSAPPTKEKQSLGETGAELAHTVPTQNGLPLVDRVAIEVAYCRHVGLTVHETARRIIAMIKAEEALDSADSAVRVGLRIEERMRAEMQKRHP